MAQYHHHPVALSWVVMVGWLWLVGVQASARSQRHGLRDEVVESCERVNVLRQETNDQAQALQEILRIAVQTRERSAAIALDEGRNEQSANDLEAAHLYEELLTTINVVEIPDCNEVVDELTLLLMN